MMTEKKYAQMYLQKLNRLGIDFYQRKDVVKVARELLGKVLVTQFKDKVTAARIVETEAYNGITDKASHAYNNRRTARTEIMYAEGGAAYVYLCYGIHHLFNVVTNLEGIPHAVLIRAGEPLVGMAHMLVRTNKAMADFTITRGPGNFSKAMGVSTIYSGKHLLGDEMFIGDDGFRVKKKDIVVTARIGVDYAQEDALLPYRFFLANNPYVSGRLQ